MRTTVILKPTHLCNLNCEYCYDRANREKDTSILPKEDLLNALKRANDEVGELHCVWHGGEPTVLGVDYLEYVMSNLADRDITWAIQTNGTLLDENWGRLFQRYNVDLGSSWDGPTNEGRNGNNTGFNNVVNLVKEYHLNDGILYTLTPKNYMNAIPAFLMGMANKVHIQYNLVFDYFREISDQEYELMAQTLVELFDLICTIPDCEYSRPFDFFINYLMKTNSGICDRTICGGKWISINSDGSVGMCGKPWPNEINYGNIYHKDFSFKSIENHYIVKYLHDIKRKQWEQCHDCQWLLNCNNGCPYAAIDFKTFDFKFNHGWCVFNKVFFDGCLKVIKNRYLDNTLVNEELLDKFEHSNNLEVTQCRNYKCHIT